MYEAWKFGTGTAVWSMRMPGTGRDSLAIQVARNGPLFHPAIETTPTHRAAVRGPSAPLLSRLLVTSGPLFWVVVRRAPALNRSPLQER